jgi:hypothetical protein
MRINLKKNIPELGMESNCNWRETAFLNGD